MSHTLAYLIGSLVTSLAWAAHHYWREYQHGKTVIIEKEKSFVAGFTHAKNLICFKPRAGMENASDQATASTKLNQHDR